MPTALQSILKPGPRPLPRPASCSKKTGHSTAQYAREGEEEEKTKKHAVVVARSRPSSFNPFLHVRKEHASFSSPNPRATVIYARHRNHPLPPSQDISNPGGGGRLSSREFQTPTIPKLSDTLFPLHLTYPATQKLCVVHVFPLPDRTD